VTPNDEAAWEVHKVLTTQGFPVDISLALPGYEDEMVARTVAYPLEPGKSVQLCSA